MKRELKRYPSSTHYPSITISIKLEKERARTACQNDYQNEIEKLTIHPHMYVKLMKNRCA